MQRENDVQLINRILLGDDEAFGILVQKYQKSVHALVWRKVRDFHYAEEVTQDTFLRAYGKLSTLRNPNLFAGWLYVIANGLCIDWLRKQKPAIQSLEEMSVKEINRLMYERYVSEQRETQATERRYAIAEKLLEKLPESERTVVTLHYLGEMTAKEIGNFLGVSVNTITSRLQRARRRLQREEELLIGEILSSIPFPANLAENIMQCVADMTPTPPPAATKPLLPWVAFGAATVLIALLLGASNRYLTRFQKPYSFEAASEHTIEIIEAPVFLDIDSKPDVRNQIGRDAPSGQNGDAGSQTSETLLTSTAGEASGQHEKNIESCTQNLVVIGEAIQTYQREHDDFPEWLSDLRPKYLTDAHVFICPADTTDGKADFPQNPDPKMSVSYDYEFHPEYRAEKSGQRLVYGDAIPLVRCRHHANEDFYALNLSFSYMIYKSSKNWEYTPEDMYDSPEAAITAFEDILKQHPNDMRFFRFYPLLIGLYVKVGNEQSADALIEQFKSSMEPDIWGYATLGDMLEAMERYEDMLQVFKEAEQHNLDDKFVFGRLAYIHKKLGNTELEKEYERKAYPNSN